jgi:hypothetical protein
MSVFVLDRALFLLHAALFSCSLAIVLFSGTVLPLADLPNHLARAYIIHNIAQSPALAEAYRVQWEFAPYFVMEITLHLLQYLMPVYAAGKVFVALCLAAIALGVISVNVALHGRLSPLTLFAYPLFFGMVFAMGFLNFLLGTGVALLSYAAWLASQKKRLPAARLFLLLNLNFFVHPISYGIFAATVFLREAFDAREHEAAGERMRRCWRIVLLTIPQLAFWVFIPRQAAGVEDSFLYGSLFSFSARMITPFVLGVNPALMIASAIGLSGLYLMCRRYRWLAIDTVHLRILFTLAVLSLLLPERALGISWLAIRLPFFAALLLIAVARPGEFWSARPRLLVTAVTAMTVLRLAIVFRALSGCSAQMEELRTTMAAYLTTPAMAILTIEDKPAGACEGLPSSYHHASSLAVIESELFAPLLFTLIPPVHAADRYRDIEMGVGGAFLPPAFFSDSFRDSEPYLRNWQQKFRYVLWLHFGNKAYAVPKDLRLLADHRDFALYETRGGPSTQP